MNTVSRTITGGIMMAIGLCLILLAIFIPKAVPASLWGIIIMVIGIFIFFNKNEDKIEEIKSTRR